MRDDVAQDVILPVAFKTGLVNIPRNLQYFIRYLTLDDMFAEFAE